MNTLSLKTQLSFSFSLLIQYSFPKTIIKTIPIAESKAIEDYLASHFNRLGSNTYERSQILAFHASTTALLDNFLGSVVNLQAPPEVKQEQMATFMTKKVPNWIRIHEEHLRANGSNGHYVGDSVSFFFFSFLASFFFPWIFECMRIPMIP